MPLPQKRLRLIALLGGLCLVASFAQGDNTTSGTAVRLTIGQIPVYFNLVDNAAQKWYDIQPRPGRSYCVGMTSAEFETNQGDSVLTVLRSDGTTVVTSNDDIFTEPDADLQSRTCFIWPAAAGNQGFIKATQLTNAIRYYHLRIVETTMFCPWFFIAGDYNAFTLIRNTTDTSVSATVNWRNSAGAIVGTTNVAIPANGDLALNAATFFSGATTANGSVEIVHDASEQALVASTTTLSATTGLGFDAMFEQRKPW
jgi:hypothetical protein